MNGEHVFPVRHLAPKHVALGCLRVSRNLEKNLAEAPQAPKFFEICHTPLSLKYNERAVG
jgi:hypothetical protein